jgi:hypothetical protein
MRYWFPVALLVSTVPLIDGAFALSAEPPNSAPSPPAESPSLQILLTAADAFASNYKQIRTWRGTVNVKYSGLSRGVSEPILGTDPVMETIDFVSDFPDESHRWTRREEARRPTWRKYPPLEAFDELQPTSIGDAAAEISCMIHHGDYYRFLQSATRTPGSSFRCSVTTARENFYYKEVVPPTFYVPSLFRDPGGLTIGDFMRGLVKIAPGRWSIVQDGSLITARREADRMSYTCIVDLASAGNAIAIILTGPNGISEHAWKYQEHDGVWVPESYTRTVSSRNDAGGFVTSRNAEYVWTESVVNEPLPEDAFSLEAIGVRRGDIVDDSVRSVLYTFGADEAPKQSGAALPKP